jgi:inhibitor of cysteine peptidase
MIFLELNAGSRRLFSDNFKRRNIMINKNPLLFALACVLILAAACSSKPARLTVADNNGQLEVKVGDKIIIELEGNPSTGYAWEAKDLDASMFQQIGDPVFKSSNPELVGSGGTITLTFKVLKTGTGTLNLVYHRPWETGVEPINTYTTTITVK